MFAFPMSTAADLFRQSIATQVSFLTNVTRNVAEASMQIGELNARAARSLMEESAAALTKGMQIRSATDAQSFLTEQSALTLDRVRGYGENMQRIATRQWTAQQDGTGAQSQSGESGNAHDHAAPRMGSSHGHGPHETDHRPSPLVEKLVASVAPDTDRPH